MALCPDCGNEIQPSHKHCRNCGSSIETVEDTVEDKEVRIHLKERQEPIICDSVAFRQTGIWIKAKLNDGTTRILSYDDIEYIDGDSSNINEQEVAARGRIVIKEGLQTLPQQLFGTDS